MRIGTFHPALTDVDTTAQTAVGGILEGDNAVYKYVQFAGTEAVAKGDVLCYTSASNTGMTIVDKPNTTLPAGVAVATVGTSSSAQFGFMQIKGVVTLAGTIGGSAVVGDRVTTQGTNAGDGVVGKIYAVNQHDCGGVLATGTAGANIIAADFPW